MDNKLTLERQEHTHNSTIGSFYYNGEFICYSLELPWRDNKRGQSCVEPGLYELAHHLWKGKEPTFCLINEDKGVTHYDNADSKRSTILLHPANYPTEINGCIAPGMIKGFDVIRRSRDGFRKLRDIIIDNEIDFIEII